MAVFDLKKATITLRDGAGTPNELVIKIGEGSLTISEKKPRTYTRDRGQIDSIRNADEEPVEVRLDFTWEFLKSTSGALTPNPIEAIKQTGAAAAWESSDDDACAPYALDIEVEYFPDCGANTTETLTIPDFRWEQLDYNLRDALISVSGKANVTKITGVRS